MLKTKSDIRKEVRARKKELSPLVFSEESNIICKHLELFASNFSSTHKVQNIVAFWPMSDEIDIRPFLESTYNNGAYHIFLPVITGDNTMEFRLFEGKNKMAQEPQFGIWEPTSSTTLTPDQISDDETLIIIVPGVAFTPCGDRLGRGRGFYDRILTAFTNTKKIGVCLSCQIYNELPTDPHDQPMDAILSPVLIQK